MAKRKSKTPPRAKKSPKKSATRSSKAAARTRSRSTRAAAAKSTRKKVAKSTKKSPARAAKKKVKKAAAKSAKRTVRATARRPVVEQSAPGVRAPMSVQWGDERIELIEREKTIPKTKLSKKELREFERMLLDKRQELVGNMENLSSEAMNSNQSAGGLSSMPLHMADIGSDNWEQEFTLGLIQNERSLVHEIDEALARIANRTYGICLATHRPIDTARLRAKPWAKYCIEYARLRELGRVP